MKRKKRKSKTKTIEKAMGWNHKPPSTRRYCLYCEKITTFKFNRVIWHSECNRCGGRCSKKNEE